MSQYANIARKITSPAAMEELGKLYGTREGTIVFQKTRYSRLLKQHEEAFEPQGPVRMISAPGRVEIGGNHTDHNHGKVLAAAVNLDCLCAVSPRKDMLVHLNSDGYSPITVDLSDLAPRKEEEGTTAAIIRGVSARMKELGYEIGGFDAAVNSTVDSGSGLSSSAAFEVMLTAVQDDLYNGFRMDYKTRAIVSQYAENVYFGKPSGLMDQMASAAGGLVNIDFRDPDPEVRPLQFDLAAHGYALVVVQTGGSHANLTGDYAAIPVEMKAVAQQFGASFLREVQSGEFLEAMPSLVGKVPDRAILRAMHFFTENKRVDAQVEALKQDRLNDFFGEIIASGRSSFTYLQNVYAHSDEQRLSVALAIAEILLTGRGAWRVHGGGFAGTTLNFVPVDMLEKFTETMDAAFGAHSCRVLDFRPEGAAVMSL